MLVAGEVLDGRYEIQSKLGEGGMGEVWQAWDRIEERAVAIKRRTGSQSDLRFENEAKVYKLVRHPGLVEVFGTGKTSGGDPYLVMERVEGTDLATLSKAQGQLPLPLIVDIGCHLLSILQEVHQHGIVHRDLKLGNLMLTKQGTIKVLDFGIAKFEDKKGQTKSTEFLGTPGYTAYEQYVRPYAVSCQADLFAVAVDLFILLSGELPYPDADPYLSLLHPPPRLTGVPEEINGFFRRALSHDLGWRFGSAAEMRDALEAWRDRGDVPAAGIRVQRRRRRSVLSRAMRAGAGALSLLAAALLLFRAATACPSDAAEARLLGWPWFRERAIRACEKDLAHFRAAKDGAREAATLFTLGDLHLIGGNFVDAREVYKQGLPLLVAAGGNYLQIAELARKIETVRASPDLLGVIRAAAQQCFDRRLPDTPRETEAALNQACAAALFQFELFAALHEEARQGSTHEESLKALAAAQANRDRLAKVVLPIMQAMYYQRTGDFDDARRAYLELRNSALAPSARVEDREIGVTLAEAGLTRLLQPAAFQGCLGTVVTHVYPETAAARVGLAAGDILLRMDQACMNEFADLLPLRKLSIRKQVTMVRLRRDAQGVLRQDEVKVDGLRDNGTITRFGADLFAF